ncbi:hypothetical protein NPIL_504891 [Nephila pilipes]|uniref:Uncharacterized protein n=1 Tax=Nephila pilipes TaxID=299642 RepID=A0A8X6P9R8_NEPPI|nr:hypothetical protein NPIL_504891 [Nephila pilipes]
MVIDSPSLSIISNSLVDYYGIGHTQWLLTINLVLQAAAEFDRVISISSAVAISSLLVLISIFKIHCRASVPIEYIKPEMMTKGKSLLAL